MTVIESATLVCDETVTAFFEEFFCDDLSERHCKIAVYAKRNSVDAVPQNMQIALFFGIGVYIAHRHIISPKPERLQILGGVIVYTDEI